MEANNTATANSGKKNIVNSTVVTGFVATEPKIRRHAETLSTHNVFRDFKLYRMERVLDNALDSGTLFYLSEDNYQSYAERSTAFLEYLNGFSAGQIFYIGGVLDYHW